MKLVLIIILLGLMGVIGYSFSPISNYVEDELYKSSLPIIEVTGFLTDDLNEIFVNLEYSVLELDYEKGLDSRYYLKGIDIDPQLIGEYVRIVGYLENDYEGYQAFDYDKEVIVKVIYVKELEIISSPLVFD